MGSPPKIETQWIEQHYMFKDHDSVAAFLSNHVFLAPVLIELYPQVQDYFPTRKIVLEVVADPDADDELLLASIITQSGVDEALEKLDLFDEGWWLLNADRARGKLCVDVGFG